jgi:hypothetical protein
VNRSFLLLGPSITALFIAVQFSLPLSLGLLGALSIVRFRTPIKEPEEIAFIMLLVATSVVCATLQFMLLFALVAVASGVLLIQRYAPQIIGPKRRDGVLLLTVPGTASAAQREQLLEALGNRLANGNLQGISYTDELMTVHYSFSGMQQHALQQLHRSLAEVGPVDNLNIYFNRQSALSSCARPDGGHGDDLRGSAQHWPALRSLSSHSTRRRRHAGCAVSCGASTRFTTKSSTGSCRRGLQPRGTSASVLETCNPKRRRRQCIRPAQSSMRLSR